jgi:hypothetical protein
MLRCEESYERVETFVQGWFKVTAEPRSDSAVTLRFEFTRVVRSYGPKGDTGNKEDTDRSDADPKLRALVGKSFTGFLNPQTGQLRAIAGLDPIRTEFLADRPPMKNLGDLDLALPGWTPLDHVKPFLGQGKFLEMSFSHLLWQGERRRRTACPGDPPAVAYEAPGPSCCPNA